MPAELNLIDLEADGWAIESWQYRGQEVTVLHREPFRLQWFATQLVTFVFIIERVPEGYQAMLEDYAALRKYAGQHKRAWLPFGLQCGYAILPVYVGEGFSETLRAEVCRRFTKKLCVFYIPSLFDASVGRLQTLKTNSMWGFVYRNFVNDTLHLVASAIDATSSSSV